METLDDAISSRMVSYGSDAHYTQQLHECCPERRLELAASVGHDCRRYAKARNPTADKGASYNFGCNVRDGECLWPSSVPVDACQDVSAVVCGEVRQCRGESCQNELQVPQKSQGSNCVTPYFGALTLQACSCPQANIHVDGWPYIPSCNKALSCSFFRWESA